MAIYDSILDTIGRTPVVKLHRVAPAHVELYAKVEAFNPAGSVKDRLALAIVLDAEAKGLLKPGDTIIEATSGNTGVALAAVAAARGYKFVATMVETFSIERRKLIRAYGGKVILTPAAERGSGMVRRAEELAKKHGWFLARQFETSANADIHEATTAQEILGDFKDQRLDYVVTGYGTGGTVTGLSRVLRRERPETKIVLTEPANAALVASGTAQERGPDHSPASGHPAFQPHPIQGWTPDFIPYVLQETLDKSGYDALMAVPGPEAIAWACKLAAQEGILTGISGGATFATAVQIAETAAPGTVILAMLPDTGERYLSTPLVQDIAEGMDDAEKALSASTPGYQLG